jgi:hypothetical protein
MRLIRRQLAIGALALFALSCLPHAAWAQKGGKGGSGGDGGTTSGPKYAIEILAFSGEIIDFNDQADVLGRIDDGDGWYTYYLGTLDTGVRTFDEIRVPAGWNIVLTAMNNSRHLVGSAKYDPDGDGPDANRDGMLDTGDIDNAGILLTPDIDNDGILELEIVLPGPLSASCWEINNDGDIVGSDQSLGRVLLRAEGTMEAFPMGMNFDQPGSPLSRRNANGDLYAVNLIGPNYLPQRYSTATGQVVSLPTFARATYKDAYAYSVNSAGVTVGRADTFPVYWSPEGSISRIPGWSTSKNATGSAFDINETGEIVITSVSMGPHLYQPNLGLVPLRNAIANPEVIPTGYQLDLVGHINSFSAISGRVKNSSNTYIPCVLHPVANPSP